MARVAESTGGNGGNLSYAQLKATWLQASEGTRYHTNKWASLMAAIAEAESSGNPLATNPNDNGGTQTSWGLWQISLGNHNEPSPHWSSPYVNAQLAIGKLDSQGLGAWGTYNSGAYRAYISDKTSPDPAGIPGINAADTAAASQSAGTAVDCLFGHWSIGLGLHLPCLLTRSNARALIGAGLFLVAGTVGGIGLIGLASATGALSAAEKAGGTVGEVAGGLATIAGAPEVGVPLAAGSSAVKKHGTAGAARRQVSRAARNRQRDQDRHDAAQFDEVASRRRDSARGPARRDQPGESSRARARRYSSGSSPASRQEAGF